MGLFSHHPKDSEANQLLNEEIRQNEAELEAKRQNLYRTRLDIIKGQGAQSWTPNTASPLNSGGGLPPPFNQIMQFANETGAMGLIQKMGNK